jgi:hypothetical protein
LTAQSFESLNLALFEIFAMLRRGFFGFTGFIDLVHHFNLDCLPLFVIKAHAFHGLYRRVELKPILLPIEIPLNFLDFRAALVLGKNCIG